MVLEVRVKLFSDQILALEIICSEERYHLCNFGRGHYGEHLSRNYIQFGPEDV